MTFSSMTAGVVRTLALLLVADFGGQAYHVSACRNDWSYMNGRCYKYLGGSNMMAIREARTSCDALNSTLAILNSQKEVDYVRDMTHTDIWLGMSADEDRVWTWDDGTSVTFTDWNCGEPNNRNANEDCAMLYITGKWNDIPCFNVLNGVVCSYVT